MTLIAGLALICASLALAEESTDTPPMDPSSEAPPTAESTGTGTPEAIATVPGQPFEGEVAGPAVKDEAQEEKKSGIARLKQKLQNKNGTNSAIGVVTPLDYTTLDYADLAEATVLQSLGRYGELNIQKINVTPNALTLEEFRKIVTVHKVDVITVVVLKPTNFDMFLFDKRTPYQIYAHSEVLPEEVQYKITGHVVEEYTKVIVRRTLYAYMQDQFYELPREEVRPLLSTEVPRWVASARNLQTLNREILARYYLSANMGAALALGQGKVWNSNLVGLQLGMRLFGNAFFEAAVDLFSYNAAIASLKYYFLSKENPFRIVVGFGAAMTNNAHTLNFDQAFTQGAGGLYLVPSFAALLPVADVQFKIEGKLFYGLSGGIMFGLMPGLMVMF